MLRVRPKRVPWLIMNGYLRGATAPDGSRGVTLQSVQQEASWRASATLGRRLRRVAGYVFRWSHLVVRRSRALAGR